MFFRYSRYLFSLSCITVKILKFSWKINGFYFKILDVISYEFLLLKIVISLFLPIWLINWSSLRNVQVGDLSTHLSFPNGNILLRIMKFFKKHIDNSLPNYISLATLTVFLKSIIDMKLMLFKYDSAMLPTLSLQTRAREMLSNPLPTYKS